MDKNSLDLNTIKEITNLFAAALKDKLEENGSNATHQLSNSIKDIVKFDGKYLTVSIQLEDYYKYVENGRKAGKFPPVDAIKKWITIKPVIPYARGKRLPNENQLSYLIGRKIAREGTRANPFLEPTIRDFKLVDKIYAAVNSMLTNEINKAVSEELK